MRYARLGRSGLTVSRLALGCMSYGNPGWRPWVLESGRTAVFSARDRRRDQFLRHRRHVLSGSERRSQQGALRAMARREEVVIATKVNFPMGDGPNMGGFRAAHPAGVRREPANRPA